MKRSTFTVNVTQDTKAGIETLYILVTKDKGWECEQIGNFMVSGYGRVNNMIQMLKLFPRLDALVTCQRNSIMTDIVSDLLEAFPTLNTERVI